VGTFAGLKHTAQHFLHFICAAPCLCCWTKAVAATAHPWQGPQPWHLDFWPVSLGCRLKTFAIPGPFIFQQLWSIMMGFIADFMKSIHMSEQHLYKLRVSISMAIIPQASSSQAFFSIILHLKFHYFVFCESR